MLHCLTLLFLECISSQTVAEREERYGAKLPGSNKLGPSALVATSKRKLEVKLCPQQNPLVVNWRFRVVQVVRGHF